MQHAITRQTALRSFGPMSDGTNVVRIKLINVDVPTVKNHPAERDILMLDANREGMITFGVNETWNRTTSAKLINAFEQALA